MGELLAYAALSVFTLQTLAFLISIKAQDASLADVFWGLGFVLLTAILLITAPEVSVVQILVAAMVYMWGFRLTYHIAKRKIGKPEDFRYAKWRKDWGRWFNLRSYFQNFLFQGLLMLIISASILVSASAGDFGNTFGLMQILGLVVWTAGYVIEVVSDQQLSEFVKTRKTSGAIMDKGLWRYSRHPNYFGEVLQWWGLWLAVLQLPYGIYAVVSPILITFLIVFVSGVPLLEKKYKSNKAYQAYASKTSKFVPKPRKG